MIDNAIAGTRPRVLILSASCGGGHARAAEAVRLALEQTCPNAVVAHVDVLDFAQPAFRRVYAGGYFDLVGRAPRLLGYLYDRLDRPAVPTRMKAMRSGLQRLHLHRLVALLTSGSWDLAISTHFLPAKLIASLRRDGRVSFPQATVVTDFHPHGWWIHDPCDRYFVASEEASATLAGHVPPETVAVTGIPIHPVFSRPRDRGECRRRHGIGAGRQVVLQLAGGQGVGPIEAVHRAILDVSRPVHLVTVAGHNDDARRQIEQLPCPARHRRTVLGYTSAIDELMAAADVIVSKPGGLTTSEALARGVPMIVIDPIPGQEAHNADHLLENGAALKASHPPILTYKLDQLLNDEDRLAELRINSRQLGRPRAAFEVARLAMELVEGEAFRREPERLADRQNRLSRSPAY